MTDEAEAIRAIRASTLFGLRQWLLWVESSGITVWRYGILELPAYLSHRLIGVPSDPGLAIDPTAARNTALGQRTKWYPVGDLLGVAILNRGSHAVQIQTRESVRLWWIRDRDLSYARERLAQLFPERYRESGYGRLWRAFSRLRRPGV